MLCDLLETAINGCDVHDIVHGLDDLRIIDSHLILYAALRHFRQSLNRLVHNCHFYLRGQYPRGIYSKEAYCKNQGCTHVP